MMQVTAPIIQVKIQVAGRPVQEYAHQGNVFVEGRAGSQFELVIRNLTHRRLLVHPMIDGISAMTGKDAERNDSDHGYVLHPYAEITVPGWRLNDREAAHFYFAGAGGSYAEKTGRPSNRGVIACPAWEEYHAPKFEQVKGSLLWRSADPRFVDHSECNGENQGVRSSMKSITRSRDIIHPDVAMHASYCCSAEQPTSGNLGTGFGETTSHKVRGVSFNVLQVEPNYIATIYYDDSIGLAKRGIRVSHSKKRQDESLPNPFPGSEQGCEPPQGWRR